MSPVIAGPSRGLVLAAFAAIYLVWGSTYLGMAIAIETIPPLAMSSLRFALAGGILLATRRALGDPWPTVREWRSAILIGSLLFLGGNGLVGWAQQWVPSGIAALLIATTPFWLTILPWAAGRANHPGMKELVGIGVGLLGVGLLVVAPVGDVEVGPALLGSVAVLVAALSWATGTLLTRSLPLPASPWMSSATQMLGGAAGLAAMGLLHGDWARFEPAEVSLRSLLAMVYLVLIGAIVGFGSYVFLLRHTTMTRLSTYAFVNPVVAVLLGWLLHHEPISGRTLLAGGLIVLAVVLLWWPRSGSQTAVNRAS